MKKKHKGSKLVALLLAALIVSSSSALVYAADTDTDTTSTTVSENAESTTNFPAERPTTPLNLGNITDDENGTYFVPVYVYARATDYASMANEAIEHTATITVQDGKKYVTINFHPIKRDGLIGHLQKFYYYDLTADEYYSNMGSVNAESRYEVTGENRIISFDDLGDDDELTFSEYISEVKFELPSNESDVICRVKVDAMGETEQDAVIVFDYSQIKKATVKCLEDTISAAKSISNDDGKYTEESFGALQSAISRGEKFLNRFSNDDSRIIAGISTLKSAISSLVVKSDILENGIYNVSVHFKIANLTKTDNAYNEYKASNQSYEFLSDLFCSNAKITAKNGVYTLKFTAQNDGNDYYLLGLIPGDSGATKLTFGGTYKSIEYFGKTISIVGENCTHQASFSNLYKADDIIVDVKAYSQSEETSSSIRLLESSERIAIDIDWSSAEKIANLPTDKTALDSLVRYTENRLSGDMSEYTDSSVANLQNTYEQAKAINENENATQEEVDAALANLQDATKALEKKPTVDTTALETKVAEAEAISNTDGKYTEESYAALTTAVESAKAVLADESKTQESVDNAVTAVQMAIEGLVEAEVEPVALTNTATIDSNTIQLGTSLTVNMGAEGGEGDYTYSVLYKKAYGTKWAVAQKPTTDTAATVKPAAAGHYYVMVKVKDASGNVAKKYFVVNVENNLKNTSALSADSIKKGESVIVNAAAEGTTGDYQYAVMYKKLSSDKWAVVQKYDANTDITFTPAAATEYEVCVKARDNNGAVAKKYFIVSVTK